MENSGFDLLFREYSVYVIRRLLSDELLSSFQDCSRFLNAQPIIVPPWQIALPVLSCLAAGGTLEDGYTAAAAWYPVCLASEILDSVEDREYLPEGDLLSQEIATNLATSFIFLALHLYASIKDVQKITRVSRLFSILGFQAAIGQHRDLIKPSSSVDKSLEDYWGTIMMKSGNVFRMGTAGAAAVASPDENLIDALGDYGTALGVMLQLIDDCRDALTPTPDKIIWETSLPLLLYLMALGEAEIIYPDVNSKAEWSNLLRKTGVINTIAVLLQEWQLRANKSLEPLANTNEKQILETIPSLILHLLPLSPKDI
jgi:geranylgeranyl pyrophosphate synthase